MTVLNRELGHSPAHGLAEQPAAPVEYRVEVARRAGESAFRGGFAPTIFQTATWLDSWYETLAGRDDVTTLVVTIRDGRTGDLALVLPLVMRRIGPLRVIEFADLNLTDYNAPLLGPAAPRSRAEAIRLWRAVRRALPRADLIRLAKMEADQGQRPNPLTLLPGAVACALNGNVIRIDGDYDGWRRTGLEKTVRKELERSWRVFSKNPGAAFVRVTEPEQAQRLLAAIDQRQETRMASLGAEYFLNEPDVAAFYRRLVERALADGNAVLTALMADGDAEPEMVAGLLGLRQGDRYIMIRIGQTGGKWANCSPGRLIIERTMAALHAEGVRTFDFSIGNYDYKRRFGCQALPLVDVVRPLSWRGLAPAARALLVGHLRTRPELDRRMRTWLGRFSAFKL
ncbi:GNAT family N-acetyltransferase [Methylobacterium sp. SD21]|uniref:GNAT family N-acetyltransferase n=1 Tax=Methylobacterium litchii TaxID=3138810 RepID=UPI00313D8542